MAANLKIGIIADNSNAQKRFEELSTSIDYTSKTVTQLANQFAKLNEANVKLSFDKTAKNAEVLQAVQKNMTVTANQLMNAIERQKLSWGTNKDSAEALRKELSELEKVESLLIQKGVGSSMSRELQDLTLITDKYAEYKKELKDIIKLKEEEEKKSAQALTPSAVAASAQSSTPYKKATLLGDDYGAAKIELESYNNALTKVINTLGEGSPEAQALAKAMKSLDSDMKKMEKTTTSTSVRIKNLVKNFVSAQMVVWAIRKAFTTVVNTLKESAEAASQAEETYNLFVTTFENVATTAERVSTRLASSMGMANSTAQKALGTFGDLAAGYGATDKAALEFGETATEVALDIISYKNISGDLDTTFQSIASGLAGNVENFRKLGYVMTQAEVKTKLQKKGLDKLTGSALQYAQIQARLEILQEKSTKAQGDMIKTLDSTENVTRRLSEAWLEYKENIGKTINTVLTPLKKAWLGILETTNKAVKAKEAYLETGSNNGVYNASTNEEDAKAFVSAMIKAGRSTASGGDSSNAILGLTSKNENTYAKALNNLTNLMGTYGASVEQTMAVLEDNKTISSELLSKIEKDITAWKEENDAKVAATLGFEEKKNKALEDIQNYVSFLDTLLDNSNTYITTAPLTYDQEQAKMVEESNSSSLTRYTDDARKYTSKAISSILEEFKNLDASEFVSFFERALGEVDYIDTLNAKLESAEAIAEELWNDFYSGGITTKAQLEESLDIIKGLRKEIESIESPGLLSNAGTQFGQLGNVFKFAMSLPEALGQGIASVISGGGVEEFFESGYASLKSTLGGAVGIFTDLISKTEVVTKVTSLLSDTVLPVLNAFLEPIADVLDIIADCIQNLLIKALNPFYKILLAIMEPLGLVLYQLTDVLGSLIQTALAPIMSLVEALVPVLVFSAGIIQSVLGVLEPLVTVLGWVMAILTPLVETVLKPIMNTLKWMFELIITGFTYIEVFFKKIIGSIGSAFMNVWNSIVKVLRGINILGWKPFGGMSYADTSKMDEWKNLKYQDEVNKRLDSLNRTTEGILSSNLSIKDNTSSDMDLTVLNDLASAGILSRDEVNSLRASYLGLASPGKQTQLIQTEAGNYATNLRAGSTQNVSYGDISIAINSESGNPEAIAKEVAKILEEWQRSGRKSFQVAIA